MSGPLIVQKIKFNLDNKEKTDDHKGPGVGQFGGSLENIATNLTKLVSLGSLSTSANIYGYRASFSRSGVKAKSDNLSGEAILDSIMETDAEYTA